MTESRKLAIKNLKGSDEEMRVSWMLKNMNQNKTFKYLLKNEKLENQNILLKSLQERYKTYRNQWRGNAKFAIKNDLIGNKFNDSDIKPLCIDIEPASVCDLACPHFIDNLLQLLIK